MVRSAILFAALALSGAVLAQRAPENQVTPPFTLCCAAVNVVANSDSFAVFWQDETGVLGRLISTNGIPIGEPVRIASNRFQPIVASDGIEFIVFLLDPDASLIEAHILGPDLRQTRMLPRLVRGQPVSAVFDGVDYILLSFERSQGPGAPASEMWLTRLTRSGTVRERQRIVVAQALVNGRVATNGSEYAVAWIELEPQDCLGPCVSPSRLRAAIFDSAFRPGRLQPRDVAREGYQPSIDWTGVDFLLTWTDFHRVRTQRLDGSHSETVIDPPGDVMVLGADAVWNGQSLIALGSGSFSDRNIYVGHTDRYGRRISALEGSILRRFSEYMTGLTVAANGTTAIAAYIKRIGFTNTYAIFVSVVDEQKFRPRAVRR